MYWSSTIFNDDDPDHTDDGVYCTVLWGATTDFTQQTYEYGGVFIDTGGDSIDTTMVQRPLPDGVVRTYRITKDNSFGNGHLDGLHPMPSLVGAGCAVDLRAETYRCRLCAGRQSWRRGGAGGVCKPSQ